VRKARRHCPKKFNQAWKFTEKPLSDLFLVEGLGAEEKVGIRERPAMDFLFRHRRTAYLPSLTYSSRSQLPCRKRGCPNPARRMPSFDMAAFGVFAALLEK
jgi:hypothetical protein